MSNCSPQFSSEIPFPCILELINDIRSGAANPRSLAIKSCWIAGCVLTAFGGPLPDVVVAADASVLDLAESISHEFEAGTLEAASIPPEVWAILIQLLLKLIGGFNNG